MTQSGDTRFPDIEIYLHDTSPQEILEWLQERFQEVTPTRIEQPHAAVHRLRMRSGDAAIVARIVAKIPGRFTGLSFESSQTPWANDAECAREAFARFRREVRCCATSWRPEQDPDEWLRIDARGETPILWKD